MINLILNGIQATNGSGTVKITLVENDNEVKIKIIDSGNGILKKDSDKIFEPLFTTKQHGTGLGLVSVKSIIEQHKGTVYFSNEPTTFTIILPKS